MKWTEEYRWLAAPLLRAGCLMLAPAGIFAAVTAIEISGAVDAWNRGISIWLQGPSGFAMTAFSSVDGWLFSAEVVAVLAAGAIAVLLKQRHWLLAASLTPLLAVVVVEVIFKYLIPEQPASAYLQVRKLLSTPSDVPAVLNHGFPSGHASRIGFVLGWLAVVLTPPRYRPVAALITCLAAFFLCWTRIYAGDHSLLEIIGGLILAAVFLIPAAMLRSLDRGPRISRPPAR